MHIEIYTSLETNTTEILEGNQFIEGPELPVVLSYDANPCATKITDTLSFVATDFDAFIYNWSTEVFTQTSRPVFSIRGSGCGYAITAEGEIQVVVAGRKQRQ